VTKASQEIMKRGATAVTEAVARGGAVAVGAVGGGLFGVALGVVDGVKLAIMPVAEREALLAQQQAEKAQPTPPGGIPTTVQMGHPAGATA
jgi:hypothetical protein